MTWRRNSIRRREETSTTLDQLSSWGSSAKAAKAPAMPQTEVLSGSMTTKLSESMVNLLKSMGSGYDWDDCGVTGPLTHAARVRTCEALMKRGLMKISYGNYELTDLGQATAAQLNQQTTEPGNHQVNQTEKDSERVNVTR